MLLKMSQALWFPQFDYTMDPNDYVSIPVSAPAAVSGEQEQEQEREEERSVPVILSEPERILRDIKIMFGSESDGRARIKVIGTISNIEEHPYLLQYWQLYFSFVQQYTVGLFILDTKGIYTPIQSDTFGVVHVVRLPLRPQPVYALTDFRNCVLFNKENRFFLFQGVELMSKEGYGYRFIGDEFHITPALSVTPSASVITNYIWKPDGITTEAEDGPEEREYN
jgi:hypothetical protein